MSWGVQAGEYLEFLQDVMRGEDVSPRGMLIKEIRDRPLKVDLDYPFMSFKARKYPLAYFKHEMLWKLGANKYDESIKQHAKLWSSVQNPDRTFNSNYGQYWFGEQNGLWNVVMELVRDPDSRRAVIPMLNTSHMTPYTVDTVCTEAIGFHIRNGELNVSVHMRSSDVIFGLGTDIPTFAFLARLVFAFLERAEVAGTMGDMTITSMSSHIYEKHFAMVNKIIDEGWKNYEEIKMPHCRVDEAMHIIAKRGRYTEDDLPGNPLMRWLCE